MKACNKCNTVKSLGEFGVNKANKDGINYSCKACESERARKNYLSAPDKLRARSNKYRAANREKVRENERNRRAANLDKYREKSRNSSALARASDPEKHRLIDKKRRFAHPERQMWMRSKSRAKMSGREFTIKVSDIVIPKTCRYLGISLAMSEGTLGPNSPSLDRIDSSKGYIPGNVEVISHLANSMKSNATWEQLVTFAEVVIAQRDEISKQVEELNELARMYAAS